MTRDCGRLRRGYTLIELLVVVMIVLILIAATLPVAKRVMESSRAREASRQLNAHLAMARAYAARNNRPFGLWMEYDAPVGWVDTAGNPTLRQVTRIYLAEVQPPYAGGTTNTKAIIRIPTTGAPPELVPLTTNTDMAGNVVADTMVEPGYLRALIEEGETFWVKFDFKGDWYRCIRGKSTNIAPYTDPQRFYLYIVPPLPAGSVASASMSGSSVPPAYNNHASYGFRFQILREPRRVGSPLELANGTCIDVQYSGLGPTGFGSMANGGLIGSSGQRLIVLFAPGGGIDGLFIDSDTIAPAGTLHFLVGRVDKVNPIPPIGTPITLDTSNIGDPNSLWVSVGRLNGSITTSENYPDIEHGLSHPSPWSVAGRDEFIEECRAVATGREQMGGQ